jgi:Helicase conserved C-terminal domain
MNFATYQEIIRMAQQKLPNQTEEEILSRLHALGDKFFDDEGLRGTVVDWTSSIANPFTQLSTENVRQITDVVRRFIRTPSFLVRHLPLDRDDLAGAFRDAVDIRTDGQLSLRQKIEYFCPFLAERCIDDERNQFLDALDNVQTGTHFGLDTRASIDAAEGQSADAGRSLLPNVRLANGEVRQETRRRLLLTFNTPLFPEILIASSVLAEGVDLHLNCRYVIHHETCAGILRLSNSGLVV